MRNLAEAAGKQLELFNQGASGRTVHEIGSAWKKNHIRIQNQIVSRLTLREKDLQDVERAVALYEEWCASAQRAIYCWIWVGQQKMVAKDIRRIVCELLWADKVAWIERAVETWLPDDFSEAELAEF